MRRRRSPSLFGLIVLGLSHTGAASALPDALRFFLSLVVIVWYPGWLLTRRLLSPGDWPAHFTAPFALLLGVSAHSVLAAALVFAGAGYGSFALLAQALVALGLAADVLRPGPPPHWRRGGGVLVALVLLGAVAWAQVGSIGFNQDAYDHIGYVRRILQVGELFPQGVLAPPVEGAAVDVPDPRKGTFHPLLALLCSVSRVEPFRAWQWLPPATFPLAFLSFLWFCGAFVRGRWRLAWCGAMFLVTWSGVGLFFADETVYGQNLAAQWLWLIVPMVLGGAQGPGRGKRGAVALAALGGVFVHAGVALHLGLLAATLVAFPGLLGVRRRDALGWAIVLALAILPGAVWRVVNSAQPNLLHAHVQGALFLTRSWFVVSPVEVIRQYGLLFAGGLALIPLAVIVARKDEDARRQLGFAVIPLLLCFVPWVATTLFHRVSYMVFRSLLNIPVFPLIVVTVVSLVTWARRRGLPARAVSAAVLIAWAVLFVTPGLRSAFAAIASWENRGNFVERHADLVRFLRTLPANSVIASDPMTSYALSAVTPHRFVAVYGQHGTPYDPLAMERLVAVRDILSPWAVTSEALQACDRFGVDFVVVNGSSQIRCTDYLTMWDAGFAPAVVPRLEGIQGRFRHLYGESPEGITVLLHDPAGKGESFRGAPRPPLGGAIDGVPCRLAAPDDAFEITSIRVEPSTTVPGDSLRFAIGYQRSDLTAPGLPIVIHLRVDNTSLGTSRRYPGDKQVRRLRERFTGRFLRFRYDHEPGACYPVDYWPIGREVSQRFGVYVPREMALGNYRVEVSMERVPMLPNFTLGDLLYNRDHYSGPSCLEAELSDRAVKPR